MRLLILRLDSEKALKSRAFGQNEKAGNSIKITYLLWRRVQDSTCSAEQAASGCDMPPACRQVPSGSNPFFLRKTDPRPGGRGSVFGGGCRIRPALRSRPPRVAACPRHAAKCPRVRILLFFKKQNPAPLGGVLFFGGGCRIRTRVGFRPNGFQDRPVMTASVTLRMSCGL